MNTGARAARAAWLGYWNTMRRYHRYEVLGLDHLTSCRPALVVGYHGRPIARDLCMLQALMVERTGSCPRAVMHASANELSAGRALMEGMAFLTGADAEMDAAVGRGDQIIVTPGGTREGCRSSLDRYRVEWGRRRGYVRLAMKYRLPIVPAAGHGVDDTYLGLNDGYALGKRLGVPGKMPVWFGVGPLGLWPVSPPWPVRITTALGEPIHVEGDPQDSSAVEAAHERVRAAVQTLLDAARRRQGGNDGRVGIGAWRFGRRREFDRESGRS